MLNKQEVMNIIAKNLHNAAPTVYEEATLTFKIVLEDGDEFTIFKAGYLINGKKTPPNDFSSLKNHCEELLEQLHIEMKKENKDWRKFSLTINQAKEVNVSFDYDEQTF